MFDGKKHLAIPNSHAIQDKTLGKLIFRSFN